MSTMSQERYEVITKLLLYNPSIPHLTAAKILVADYPNLFQSVEVARSSVRGCTGNNGRDRRMMQKRFKEFFRQPFTGDELPIPTPFWDSSPFIFDTESCLIIADAHIPFHEPDAIELAVSYAKKKGVKDLFILGDWLDHYQESEFVKRPDVSTLTQELADGKQSLQWLRKKFSKGRIIYKEGNHEERFAVKVHKCMPQAGELLDEFTYEKMGFKELGIELVTDRRRVDMGYLSAIHGHELGKGTAILVNAARTVQLRAKECCIVAHWHQSTGHRVRTLRQKHIGTWSLGCMCILTPHYRPVNDWALGFAIYRRKDSAGNFIVNNHAIIDGDVV